MIKGVITDIAGTLVHNNLVDQLMNDFRTNGAAFIRSGTSREATKIYEQIAGEFSLANPEAVINHVGAILGAGDKSKFRPDYLELSGLISAQGYETGKIVPVVFPDVAPALKQWRRAERGVFAYSSGDGASQRRIFRFSTAGDITHLFDGFIDTKAVGGKHDPEAYRRISDKVEISPSGLAYLADSVRELEAANKAGYGAVWQITREGNKPEPAHPFVSVTSLDQISFDGSSQ